MDTFLSIFPRYPPDIRVGVPFQAIPFFVSSCLVSSFLDLVERKQWSQIVQPRVTNTAKRRQRQCANSRQCHICDLYEEFIFCSLGAAAGSQTDLAKKCRAAQVNRAADHYDEFYLWQTIKLAGNGSRLLAPRLRQGLDHRVITILFLPEDDVKRALNQLSLMLQQPLTANDNPPVIATMKAIDRNVEGILLAPQRLGRHYPAGQLLAEILPPA